MIPSLWAGRPYLPPPPVTTRIGYPSLCEHGHEATTIQTESALQGIGEGGMVRSTYRIECQTCDNPC